MSNFSINEMLSMQKELQEKYKNKWEAISPEAGKHKLLWMIGEIGEVIDIIKKNGDKKDRKTASNRNRGERRNRATTTIQNAVERKTCYTRNIERI